MKKAAPHYFVRVTFDPKMPRGAQRLAADRVADDLRERGHDATVVRVEDATRHAGLPTDVLRARILAITHDHPRTVQEIREALTTDGLTYSRSHLSNVISDLSEHGYLTRAWRGNGYVYQPRR